MKTLRNLLALAIAVIAASCSTKVEPTVSIFRLEGVEPAVHYTAPTPLTDINNSNIFNSSIVKKPYKLISSSLTC